MQETVSNILDIDIKDLLTSVVKSIYVYPLSSLVMGELFGFKSDIPYWLRQDLTASGLIHVVVVSGYNISFLMIFISNFLNLFNLKKFHKYIICLSLTLFYVSFVGLSAPVIRAYLMSSLAIFGKISGRRSGSLRLLFFCALLMVLYDRTYLESISFQLSFLATFGLVSLSEPISNLLRGFMAFVFGFIGFSKTYEKISNFLNKFIFTSFSESLACSITTWPIISFNFGRVSILSPIANALSLFTIGPVMVGSLLSLLLYFIPFPIYRIPAFMVSILLRYFMFIADAFSNVGVLTFWVDEKFLMIYFLFLFVWVCRGSIKI